MLPGDQENLLIPKFPYGEGCGFDFLGIGEEDHEREELGASIKTF